MAGNVSPNLPWELARTKWASVINPILANPLVNGNLLTAIKVVTGANVINHGLGRALQGYFVTLNNSAVTFYDSQSSNQQPSLTLILNASGPSTISLYVF